MMQQINIFLIAGQDGGLIVYELVDGENVLVFGGDLEASTKYLTGRMSKIIVTGERPQREITAKKPVREITISDRLRSLDEAESAA